MADFISPAPQGARVSATYQDHLNRGGSYNGALDFAVMAGTPVVAVADGVVQKVQSQGKQAYGLYIAIIHPNGYRSLYAHLRQALVDVGDQVAQGQVIGLSGGDPADPNSGNSSGAHLHFELQKAETIYTSINPAPIIGLELPASVTKKPAQKKPKRGQE